MFFMRWLTSTPIALAIRLAGGAGGDWQRSVSSALEAEYAGKFVKSSSKSGPPIRQSCLETAPSGEFSGTHKDGSVLKLRLCSEPPVGSGEGGLVVKAVIIAGLDEERVVAVKFNTKEIHYAYRNFFPESGRELMESEIEAASRLGGGMFMEYIGRVDGKTLGLARMIQRKKENGTQYPFEQDLTYPGLVMELIDGHTVGKILQDTPKEALAKTTACFAAQYLYTFHEEMQKGLMTRDLSLRNAMVSKNENTVFQLTQDIQCPKITVIDLGITVPFVGTTPVRDFMETLLMRVVGAPTSAVATHPDQLAALQDLLVPRIKRAIASIQDEAEAVILDKLRLQEAALSNNPALHGPYNDGYINFLRQLVLQMKREPAVKALSQKEPAVKRNHDLSRYAMVWGTLLASLALLAGGACTCLYLRRS